MLEKYLVGTLEAPSASSLARPLSDASLERRPLSSSLSPPGTPEPKLDHASDVALRGKGKPIQCRLSTKEYVVNDVLRLVFDFPDPEQRLGLPVGKHIGLRAVINGEKVMRQYTPVSDGEAKGHVELLVKVRRERSRMPLDWTRAPLSLSAHLLVSPFLFPHSLPLSPLPNHKRQPQVYRANQHPRFPEGGKMSQYLDRLSVGAFMDIDGPLGHIVYKEPGCVHQLGEDIRVKHFVAVAGGTGITPVVQVLRSVLSNPGDDTTLSLVYAARTPEDLLLREELDALAEQHEQFKVWYTVDMAPADWTYSVGFVSEAMLADRFPKGSSDVGVLICGPPPMINFAIKPSLEKLGYKEEQLFIF